MSASAGSGVPQRFIHDQRNGADMTPGPVVRAEGQPPVDDPAVNQAYDNFGDTYKFYWEILHRDSIDDQGMPIHGMVHFDTDYNNAFWDGEGHMWFGDGDGTLFSDFTNSLDVIGHELTHGVTQYTANLAYSGQSGALNESLSDVFGSLVEQYAKQQTVEQADWLIGAEVVGPQLAPALRSMKAPGTAEPVRQAAQRTWTASSSPTATTAASTPTPASPTGRSTSRPRPWVASRGRWRVASGTPR